MGLLAALATAALTGQPTPPLGAFDQPALGGVSLGADAAGRRALCAELSRLAADPEALFAAPGGGEVACAGDGADSFVARLAGSRADLEAEACRLAVLPAPVVFSGMRPLAPHRRSPPLDALDLQLTLERLGVRRFDGLLAAFGFANLIVSAGPAQASLPVHESPQRCRPGP